MTTQENLDYFRAIPWCRAFIDDLKYATCVTFFSRQIKASGEDELLARTLNTSSTLPQCLAIYAKPVSSTSPIEELRAFYALERGVNGWSDMLHGGIAAVLLDEMMGMLLHLNKELNEERMKTEGRTINYTMGVTAELTIKYLKAVPTPSVVCVRCWLAKVDGRKAWSDGAIEDEKGTPLVKGSGLFVQIRPPKL